MQAHCLKQMGAGNIFVTQVGHEVYVDRLVFSPGPQLQKAHMNVPLPHHDERTFLAATTGAADDSAVLLVQQFNTGHRGVQSGTVEVRPLDIQILVLDHQLITLQILVIARKLGIMYTS